MNEDDTYLKQAMERLEQLNQLLTDEQREEVSREIEELSNNLLYNEEHKDE